MKVFISSDIEGTAGITHWHETDREKGGSSYAYYCEKMTDEVVAACEGALAAGATGLLVKDAHESGRNIIPDRLPAMALLRRAWSGHPYSMVAGLDDSFDALAFTGYHSPAYADGNPLAHTMNLGVDEITINGMRTSEFIIHSYVAGSLGVPVVFVSGDKALCEHAKAFIPGITTVATFEGDGNATTSIHPSVATARIQEGMRQALSGDLSKCMINMPESFEVTVRYRTHHKAHSMSFYPGVRKLDEHTIGFTAADYFDVVRCFHFIL